MGEYEAAECADYWQEHDCAGSDSEKEADSCDYQQCDSKDGGDCWIEECNMMHECKPYTCTKWEFQASRNHWTAEDCDDHKDDEEDMNFFKNIFAHAGKAIAHYDDTLEAVAAYYITEHIEENFDGEEIDSFLANDSAKTTASVIIQDTEEMLDSFGLDANLGWMHDALEADDADELADMFDDVFEDFWSGDNYENYGDYSDYEDCSEEGEEFDCFDRVVDYVDGAESCTYFESCDECWVYATANGEYVEGSCEEMMEMYGIPEYDDEEWY
jgi:hypothetical protein